MVRRLMLAGLVAVAACGGQSADRAVPSASELTPEQKTGGELLPQGAPAVESAAAGTLTGATWEWVSTQTPVEVVAPDDPAKYTLVFGEDGKVAGSADCNRLMGTYKLTDGQLEFSPLATTRKACPPGGRGDWYVKQLGFVRHHFFSGADTLRLDLLADGGTFTFRRAR